MAIYVMSDIHGHVRALEEVLDLASPGDDDEVYVLGDMVDRGPAPVDVIRRVRSLPNVHVLMGNHEMMLLDVLLDTGEMDGFTWALNGGFATATGLDVLDHDEYAELIDWMRGLPLFAVAETESRRYILTHAGIDAMEARGYLATAGVDTSEGRGAAEATEEQLLDMMSRQLPETLLWTREEFWGQPTGFVGKDGTGPVVVVGHTPSIVLSRYADRMANEGVNEDGRGIVVPVGACDATGGVADRIDIDCSAAAGAPRGRVGLVRLDDGAVWYGTIKDGE
mgnify:FL=1